MKNKEYSIPLSFLLVMLISNVAFVSSNQEPSKVFSRPENEGQEHWNELAKQELERALKLTANTNVAKNVILFMGDGMSLTTLTAARIYKGQQNNRSGEEGYLTFERFPHMGLSKTYTVSKQVSDSAGTATAYLCGVKTNAKVVGVDHRVQRGDCTTMTEDTKLTSVLSWAQKAGKRTGIVTNNRLTHASMAPNYAHSADRTWESDGVIDLINRENCPEFKDIARQFVEEDTGKNINVAMGGSFQCFDADITETSHDPSTEDCKRTDGRKLWQDWQRNKQSIGSSHKFIRTKTELEQVPNNTDYVLGLFANGHMPYEYKKKAHNLDLPSLPEMTEKAIKLLQQGENGFFLMVEAGLIDDAHHDCNARIALDETLALDRAVQKALEMTSQEDTLIVVTADHSHALAFIGDPARGHDILGSIGPAADQLPYTTLMYSSGLGYKHSVENGTVTREDVNEVSTTDWEYKQQATIPYIRSRHSGDDVAIYAMGPMSHLFHSLHEQNYIAHVMSYAACIGNNKEHCDNDENNKVAMAQHLVFVYGTLKRNEPNHHWLTNSENGVGKLLGMGKTVEKLPLVIASRYNIPMVLAAAGKGENIEGEVYLVDMKMLRKLDILEDHPKIYERKVKKIKLQESGEEIDCWIYLLHKFKPQLSELPFLNSYHSEGDHGLPYVTSYEERNSKSEPGYEYWKDIKEVEEL